MSVRAGNGSERPHRVIIAGGGTGGHLMPALALADALAELAPWVEPVLVGASRGVEASILPNRPYRYHLLPAEPLYRHALWKNLKWPVLFGRLVRAASRVVREEAPRVAVGTGGYAAGPVLAMARTRSIPLVLQEQNAYPGLTTRLLARFATQVHLGFPEAASRLHQSPRVQVSSFGNPISIPDRRPSGPEARVGLGVPPSRPVLLVVGGSQGALRLNRSLAAAIERGLLPDITLLWSTGRRNYEEFRTYHRLPDRVVRPFWDPISEAYAAADLAVCRAGAMTTAELCAFGLPSILVPLPSAAGGHQSANARALEAAGASIHLPEDELAPERLAELVRTLVGTPETREAMARAARSRARPDAARRIAESILGLIS